MADGPLVAPEVGSVPEAIARMEAIEATLTPRDGIACFNHLYLNITRRVFERLQEPFFAEQTFIDRLDVSFANRFFSAVRNWAESRLALVPRSWRALAERRDDDKVTRMQFALAGMNAHINYDLALAVVSTVQELGRELESGTHRHDFDLLNEIFRDAEEELRREFSGDLARFDEGVVRAAANAISHWSITHARDLAWQSAEILDSLEELGPLRRGFEDNLDRVTSFAGRGLLVRVLP